MTGRRKTAEEFTRDLAEETEESLRKDPGRWSWGARAVHLGPAGRADLPIPRDHEVVSPEERDRHRFLQATADQETGRSS
jgi:hypothetical protein